MNKYSVYGLISLSALLGTTLRLSQKYALNHMSIYSVIIIEALITGIVLVIAGLYLGGFKKLQTDLTKLNGKTLTSLLVTSASIVIISIIGYNLILSQKLSSLALVHTGVEVIATMVLASMFLGDKITPAKMLAVLFLSIGVYLAQ